MKYREAFDKMVEYDKTLTADDNRFNGFVYVVAEDRSVMFFTNAFAMKIGEFVAVFTEHHGPHLRLPEEIKGYFKKSEQIEKMIDA